MDISSTSLSSFFDKVFPNKPEDKKKSWLQILQKEEFETLGDLQLASEETWSSLPLPLAVRDALRQNLKPKIFHTPLKEDTRLLTQVDVVVFDVSSSMRSKSFDPLNSRLGSAKIFFHTMVDKLVGHELPHILGLVLFGQNITVMPFVRDYETFHDTLGNADASENSTKLYDAIYKAGEEVIRFRTENPQLISSGEEPCKYRIFCLTDGEDNASTHSYWRVAKFLQENNIILDAIPLATKNKELQAMATATGGLCLNVTDMERGVALFEREAIMHVANRETTGSLPEIINESSLVQAAEKIKVLEDFNDVKTVIPQAMNKQVMKKDDLVKAEQAVAKQPDSGAVRRILTEYRQIYDNPIPLWHPFINADNTSFWKVIMEGPPNTPYEGGRWILYIKFPATYPFHPPEVRFITPIYHCNVNNDGKICLDVLTSSWSPSLNVRKCFTYITELLCQPNPTDALDAVKANVYSDNKDVYNRLAAQHKEAHALTSMEELKIQFQISE